MRGYYDDRLAGRRLERCYELASPRVRRYLDAEIRYADGRLPRAGSVLELGCGYGRVVQRLATADRRVIGVDTAGASLALARETTPPGTNARYLAMDAAALGFADAAFDAVVCIQNGICAFGLEPHVLACEALRVTRPGGRVLLSTYADRFWNHRLAWFEAQAAAGLLGPLDRAACRDGVIAGRDGFRSGRLLPADWEGLCRGLTVRGEITEVDGSSLFCTIEKGRSAECPDEGSGRRPVD